ncbi:hypothetical protein [Tissierella sp.]|uniref:hypothetical protein n=1 Tax=Tissierella sp. TaxID=41274 RepID=UPI00302084DD
MQSHIDLKTLTDPKALNVHYDFKCFKCQTRFPVYFWYLKNKDGICCPNCGQKLPSDVLKNLKESIFYIENALKTLNDTNEHESGWSLSIQWNSLLDLPPRPSEYDHLSISLNEDDDYSPFNVT